ncbi:hypothetical protein EYF80_040687 [Liparis tanakae]|uniref:Uncharacterized protein n=1 Tax=Liparis tanakae TaxID=230148 RepID=A0A4Z2G977_9TELE|nr:hypothetical protein EYF80_040687 [Liparis tanakae]
MTRYGTDLDEQTERKDPTPPTSGGFRGAVPARTQVRQHGGLQAAAEGGGGVMEFEQRVEAPLVSRPLHGRAQAHGDGGDHGAQGLDQEHRHHLLRVPRGEQRVVELRQLLVQTELAVRDVLPHAHQLALGMPTDTHLKQKRTSAHAYTKQAKSCGILSISVKTFTNSLAWSAEDTRGDATPLGLHQIVTTARKGGGVEMKRRSRISPRDMELKVDTICGLARASRRFFSASR